MTDKTKEALKQALEALQTAHLAVEDDMLADEIRQAITAIREALASKSEALALVNKVDQEESSGTGQPAQHSKAKQIAECLAMLRPKVKGKFPYEQAFEELVGYIAAPQPAPVAEPRKPQQEPLTNEHIERIYNRYGGDMMNCARAIEREHGIYAPSELKEDT